MFNVFSMFLDENMGLLNGFTINFYLNLFYFPWYIYQGFSLFIKKTAPEKTRAVLF